MRFKIANLLFVFGILVALLQNFTLFTILGTIFGFVIPSINKHLNKNESIITTSNCLVLGLATGGIIMNLFPIIIGALIGSGFSQINDSPKHEKLNTILKYFSLRADENFIYY